jgi:hypothetical protein
MRFQIELSMRPGLKIISILLKITKTVFGFKRSQKFFVLIWIALPGRYGRAGRGRLDGSPLRRELFADSAHSEVQLVLLLLPTGVLGLRALLQCGPLGRVAWSKKPSEV